jgi:hypothetical protein
MLSIKQKNTSVKISTLNLINNTMAIQETGFWQAYLTLLIIGG